VAELVRECLDDAAFARRPLSWVALRDGFFLKIPRLSEDPRADLEAASAVQEAAYEFTATSRLAVQCSAVPAPVGVFGGCLVTRRLEVRDLRDELLATADPQALAQETARFLGTFHRTTAPLAPTLDPVDYHGSRMLPTPPALLARIAAREPTVTARGFELRNLLRERGSGQILFIDPHEVGRGAPEEDFARLVVSLLMARWARGRPSAPWTSLDLFRLRTAYEAEHRPLDAELLRHMMRLNIAMRRGHALESVARMRFLLRPAGRLYTAWYFSRIERWSEGHGV